MSPESEQRVARWFSQKWIFESIIGLMGFDAVTAGVMRVAQSAIGPEVARETEALRQRITKFGDIKREVARSAERRKQRAKDEEARGHLVTARENFFMASLLYGVARWAIWEDDNPDLHSLDEEVVQCYSRYIAHSEHPIERFETQFEGKTLYSLLHLPRGDLKGPVPCVLYIPGMDNFKELLVNMYGDKLLERGIAVMALDGPGQGETLTHGLKVTIDNYERAAKAVVDGLSKRREHVDPRRVALRGRSFGTYWGPRVMANDSRIRAGAFMAVCHEPGGKTLFGSAPPTYKLRHMWIAGYDDEDKFDEEYATKLTLKGVGDRIKSPVLILAGENDDLSPIEYTYRFFREISGPKRLFVYEGARHGVGDPNADSMQADFLMDRLAGRRLVPRSETFRVELGGTTKRQ